MKVNSHGLWQRGIQRVRKNTRFCTIAITGPTLIAFGVALVLVVLSGTKETNMYSRESSVVFTTTHHV